jgi:hypothetical protein
MGESKMTVVWLNTNNALVLANRQLEYACLAVLRGTTPRSGVRARLAA